MLGTLFRSLLTSCPRHVRAMGYLREQLSIQTRYERCRRAWEPHLERTKAIVRAAIAHCPRRRKAVVFGSGPLLDVPLAELASTFDEVLLVDIVHAHGGDWQVANVRTVTADVTGVAEAVHRVAHDGAAPLPRVAPTLFLDDPDLDLAASVNLLSQLPYLPCDYLIKAGAYSRAAIEAFGRDIVLAHIDYLKRLPGVVALICDLERLTCDGDDRLVERLSALRGVTLPWSGEEWVWDLAPPGEWDPYRAYRRRVVGIVDVKTAPPTRG